MGLFNFHGDDPPTHPLWDEIDDHIPDLEKLTGHYFKLVDGTPVPCGMLEAAESFSSDRSVDWTQIDENCYVSTAFLVINHSFDPKSPPLLFETMVFGGTADGYQLRYSTIAEARLGHRRVVRALMSGLDPDADTTHENIIDRIVAWFRQRLRRA